MHSKQHLRVPVLENVSWDDIGLSASIAEFDSLRQAARAFDVNASTLVRRIEKLEATLGTRILDRHPRGARMNDAGLAIAEVARDMRKHFLRLQDVVKRDENAKGRVKIAVTEGLGAFWLTPRLPDFAAAHPEILLDIEISMDLKNLLRNEADVAIQFKKPDNPDVIASRLCHVHIYPFASLGYLEQHGLPALDDRRSRHKLVLQESAQTTNDVILEFLRSRRVETDVAFVTNSSVAHLHAVEKGMGVGGLPTFAMAMGARLVPIDVGLSHTVEVWLSYRREMRKLKRVVATIEWLRKVFDPKRYPWFAPDFRHPAEIMAEVNRVMDRKNDFDSALVRRITASPEVLKIENFERKPGRPRGNDLRIA